MERLDVAVIGGGIGGLTAGIAMKRLGYGVRVYERAPEILPIGGGISLWPNGVKLLDWLGIGHLLEPHAGSMSTMRYVRSDGLALATLPLDRLTEACGRRPLPVTRTDLQASLIDAFGRESLHLGAECIGVETGPDDRPVARFADGGAVTGDVLIGADGIRSVVRDYVGDGAGSLRYAGNVNWNGLVTSDERLDADDCFTIYVGEARRVGTMPMGDGRLYYFFDAPLPAGAMTEREHWRSELQVLFGHWTAPVRALLDRVDPQTMVRVDVCDLDAPERTVRGRVALLGDAAHAATPTLGQGAAQAMEDCEILSRCLKTTSIGVEDALERYERDRRQRTHAILEASRARTDLMMGADPAATEAWYEELRTRRDGRFVDQLIETAVNGPLG